MPKTAPDTVISYRIELQESERQVLKDWVAGQNAAIITKSLDELLTVENLFVGATILEIITGEEILFGTFNDISDLTGIVADLGDWWKKRQVKREADKEGAKERLDDLLSGNSPYGNRGADNNETDDLVLLVANILNSFKNLVF